MSVSLYTDQEVKRGMTFRVTASIKTYPVPPATEGDPENPDSHIGQLLKPDGIQEGGDYTTPTQTDTGEFYETVTIPADGDVGTWSFEWEITASGEKWTERVFFEVVD